MAGFTIAAMTLIGVTLLLSFGSYRVVQNREGHLRGLVERSLTVGAYSAQTPFELEPGTLVTMPSNSAGQRVVIVHWQSAFAAFGDSAAWIIICGLPICVAMLLATSFGILRVTLITPLRREIRILSKQAREARSLQMFAHDVRKPFSAVKAVVQLLKKERSAEATITAARRLLPEVDSLLTHVDQMITDLLRNGNTEDTEQSRPLDMILESAVREAARKHPAAKQKIDWQLNHCHQVDAPAPALSRAVANLLCNAIEAITPADRIWVTSRDRTDGQVCLTIGNTGPVIPSEILNKLFTPFFTTGKQDGTGLGLTYVQTVVHDAGGSISIRSNEDIGTEFTIILPAARRMDKPTIRLPPTFNERLAPEEHECVEAMSGAIRILVVDDNDCYADALKDAALEFIAEGHCYFTHAKSAQEAFQRLSENPDLLICDIDLGSDSESGVSVIRAATKKSTKPAIYVHSNAELGAGDEDFVARHTDGFLVKPVSAKALASVIARHLKDVQVNAKPVVAIIDDDCFVRELWTLKADEITPLIYESPQQFLDAIDENPALLATLHAVIVDYYFENAPGYTGDLLARAVRERREVPVIMASDATGLSEETVRSFDLIVSKDCMDWNLIAPQVSLPA